MAAKNNRTGEQIRQDALKMLEQAKLKIIEEKREKLFNLGKLINQYVDGDISGKQMKAEVFKIKGKEFPEERSNSINNITESEVLEALK